MFKLTLKIFLYQYEHGICKIVLFYTIKFIGEVGLVAILPSHNMYCELLYMCTFVTSNFNQLVVLLVWT